MLFLRLLLLSALGIVGVTACGPPGDAPGPAARETSQPIVGGYVDERTTGVVGLGIQLSSEHHSFFAGHCSGTLIAPNLVLTARHCVAMTGGTDPDEGVVCGETEFTVQADGDAFLVSPATTRPLDPADRTFYRGREVRPAPGANDICGYDLALIILEGKGIPPEVARPIVPRIDSPPTGEEEFSASGYGLTDPDGEMGGVRMRIDGVTVRCTGDSCVTQTIGVRETEWLSADAPLCPGDSGGPALDVAGRVMGVASRGRDGCGATVFANVASWRDFIIDTAVDAAALGGYEPPFWTDGSSELPLDTEAAFEPAGAVDAGEPSCEGGQECADAVSSLAARDTSACSVKRSAVGGRDSGRLTPWAIVLAGLIAARRRRRAGV